jgi:photosynthetic reaction center cytochrome c subunit
MEPLGSVFPANRKGPQGDVLKVNCATCHNGVNKPLGGFSMAKEYPELSVPNP